MSWNIVRHAFRMIFGNIGQALRVSVGPYLILLAVAATLFNLFMGSMPMGNMGDPDMSMPDLSPAAVLVPLILLPLIMFVTSWVAVSWHRFILREEYTELLPAVAGRPIWPYAGKAILLGLLLVLILLPFSILAGAISAPMLMAMNGGGNMQAPFSVILLIFVGSVLMTYLSLRWGVSLPATAMGEPMTFRESWGLTRPLSITILGVSAILMAINFLPGLLLGPVYMASGVLGMIIEVVVSWVTIMLGISILTTLYGHVVEGRALAD